MLPPVASELEPERRRSGQETDITTALRRNYDDAVRLAAREEILADLAEDVVTANLHADTARFHHGSAHAYAKALDLLLGEGLSVVEDKEKAKAATRDADLGPMRCQGSSVPELRAGPVVTGTLQAGRTPENSAWFGVEDWV